MTTHAFVAPTRGPSWLCAQCRQGREAPIHGGAAPK